MKFKIGDKVRLNPNMNWNSIGVDFSKEGVIVSENRTFRNYDNCYSVSTMTGRWSIPESFLMRGGE